MRKIKFYMMCWSHKHSNNNPSAYKNVRITSRRTRHQTEPEKMSGRSCECFLYKESDS